jgi:hypothetical protein
MLDSHKTGKAYILAQTAEMNKIYEAARARLMQTIVKHAQMYSSAPYTGKYLVKLSEQLQTEYAVFEQQLRDEMDYSIPYVAQSYYLMALNDMEVKDSKSVLGNMDKQRVKYFVEAAYNDIGGATKRMQDTDIAHLRDISAKVFRESSLTGETRANVSKRLLNEATAMPGFRFVDKAGRKWDSKSYFDMLGRTVLMNASRASYMDACAAEGDDVVRVSVSGNPCPACAAYENTLLSISGATPGLPTVDEAIADGLMHPNCTHSLVAVPPAMMEKYYNENGRPNTGLNSPDNIQVDNAETQKEYRQQQELQAGKADSGADRIISKSDALELLQNDLTIKAADDGEIVFGKELIGKYQHGESRESGAEPDRLKHLDRAIQAVRDANQGITELSNTNPPQKRFLHQISPRQAIVVFSDLQTGRVRSFIYSNKSIKNFLRKYSEDK